MSPRSIIDDPSSTFMEDIGDHLHSMYAGHRQRSDSLRRAMSQETSNRIHNGNAGAILGYWLGTTADEIALEYTI